MSNERMFHRGAVASMVLLILWLLAWEMAVAPLHPGGSILALKVLPLLVPLHGTVRRDIYTMQWSSMLVLLYFTEGVVRGYSDKTALSAFMGWGEVALVIVYFACALLFLRPYKKAARKLAAELLERMNDAR